MQNNSYLILSYLRPDMSLACYLVQGHRVFLASEGATLVDSFDAPGSLYPNHAHSSTPVTIVSFWTLAFPCGAESGCGPVAWKKNRAHGLRRREKQEAPALKHERQIRVA